jgi:hypothetical protein
MNRDVFYISDFFFDQVLGGGELNDSELLKILNNKGYQVKKKNCHLVDVSLLKENKSCLFIVSNFINLSEECKNFFINNIDYIIYEHDHKYLKRRNPALFKEFLAPKDEIINLDFYKSAKKIFCQSSFHKNIVFKNTNLDNLESLSGNLWPIETLEFIRKLSKENKQDKCSIMNSTTPHKNTHGSIRYANKKNLDYDLIQSNNYYEFLTKLSKNKSFVFLPKTPETLSRVLVEARMLGCKVITNDLVGASKEEWFGLKGEQLIDFMKNKREEIYNKIAGVINE